MVDGQSAPIHDRRVRAQAIAVLLAVAFVAGCASALPGMGSSGASAAEPQVWKLDRVGPNRGGVLCIDHCGLPVLRLDQTRGRASGELCGERVFGPYSSATRTVRLSSGWLSVSCDPDSAVDRAAQAAMRGARSVRIEGDILTLYDANWTWLAEFRLAD
jgi:hypothetical protein